MYAAFDAFPSPGTEAPAATREMMRNPSWPTSIAANVQNATLPAVPRPTPRNPKVGRYENPMRLSGQMRMSACAATPSVADPPRRAILSGVHVSRVCGEAVFVPKTTMKTSRPMIATMLLSTGAHM